MDRTLSRSKSGQLPDSQGKEETLRDTILKKFSFLTPVKNYVTSKLRTGKYEIKDKNTCEVSIISYDQHDFNEVEKKYDLIPSRPSVDEKIAKVMKNAVDQMPKEEFLKISKERLELMQVVERTFNRQLDIFESLLQTNLEDRRKKEITSGDASFIDDLISKVVKELKGAVSTNTRTVPLSGKKELKEEKNLGDHYNVKTTDIKCECQEINGSGAAVSKISSSDS